jgi:2'-hydroxyisoflavone reductase
LRGDEAWAAVAIFGFCHGAVKPSVWYHPTVRLLVLGGTKFLGRAAVEAALARGHEVTLFNRGETNPELFPEAERLRGDRTDPRTRSVLRDREWDAVIDPSGFVPGVVRASADLLADAVGHYLFVSSVSVYASQAAPNDEDSPLAELGDMPDDRLLEDFSNYGALKALCEAAVAESFGERQTSVRPGLIVGAHDPTGRFTYWPHRIARGGEVLAPAPPERRVQFVDARDLGPWLVDLCERRAAGAYNATHPGRSWGDVLETCREVTKSDATFTWVPEAFLVEHDVGEWMELPMWIQDPEEAALHQTDVSRAIEAGLGFRPLEETVRDTLELARTTAEAGLGPEREAELLAAAHS